MLLYTGPCFGLIAKPVTGTINVSRRPGRLAGCSVGSCISRKVLFLSPHFFARRFLRRCQLDR